MAGQYAGEALGMEGFIDKKRYMPQSLRDVREHISELKAAIRDKCFCK